MSFGKYFTQWAIVTVVFGVLALVSTKMAPTHTLWPFGISFLYIATLILMTAKVLIEAASKTQE